MRRIPEGLRKIAKEEFVQSILVPKDEIEWEGKTKTLISWKEINKNIKTDRKSLRW